NHTFSSNESLWISKQNDPNEARAQLITLRRSVLKLTGDVLNDDPRDLQLLPIAGRLKCAHVNHVEALCDAEDVLVWSVAVTPAIEKLSVWELDGKHSWKSLPDIHSRANNPTSRMMRFAQLSTVKSFSPN
ncbi:phosphopantetheinyl transferase, partial [Shigella flexneri]|nr:phosphopantetheinyl transferase [Shigella flexneri]